MLAVVTYQWGQKYPQFYVDRLRAAVKRNLLQPHRLVVVGDGPNVDLFIPDPDRHLCEIKGCFARLRLFDPLYQENVEIVAREKIDRIACVDLDNVITGPLDPIFDIDDPFAILQGANAANPCPYNGSVWMVRAGYRPDVWSDFSIEAAHALPHYEFPDDQGWLAHKLPGAKSWKVGASGIYGFEKMGWTTGDRLPDNASVVAFFGKRDPSKSLHLDWVRKHWR